MVCEHRFYIYLKHITQLKAAYKGITILTQLHRLHKHGIVQHRYIFIEKSRLTYSHGNITSKSEQINIMIHKKQVTLRYKFRDLVRRLHIQIAYICMHIHVKRLPLIVSMTMKNWKISPDFAKIFETKLPLTETCCCPYILALSQFLSPCQVGSLD